MRSSSSAHGWLSLPPLNMDHTAGCGMTWRITQTVKLSPSGCQAQPIHLLSQLVEIQAQLLHPVRVSYTQLLGTTELTGFVGAATAHVADKPMSCAGPPFRFPNYKSFPADTLVFTSCSTEAAHWPAPGKSGLQDLIAHPRTAVVVLEREGQTWSARSHGGKALHAPVGRMLCVLRE